MVQPNDHIAPRQSACLALSLNQGDDFTAFILFLKTKPSLWPDTPSLGTNSMPLQGLSDRQIGKTGRQVGTPGRYFRGKKVPGWRQYWERFQVKALKDDRVPTSEDQETPVLRSPLLMAVSPFPSRMAGFNNAGGEESAQWEGV